MIFAAWKRRHNQATQALNQLVQGPLAATVTSVGTFFLRHACDHPSMQELGDRTSKGDANIDTKQFTIRQGFRKRREYRWIAWSSEPKCISILVSIFIALSGILEYTTCCGLLLTLGVDMEDTNRRQIVKYSPISPAVLFHRMRTDINQRWDQSKMVDAVRRWLRPPKQKRIADNRAEQCKTSSNIIIPDAHDPFMLLAKSDPMSNLLAENNRLRNLINELLVEDRRTHSPEFRH